MIAKRIDRTVPEDNYRALGLYIADASHEGEKLLVKWHAGCLADSYLEALIEIEATQELNTRTTKDKTYHLMISFRPEDEVVLTPDILHDIEATVSKALGFEEHQRLCGVHKNTNNVHLHMAYNMIHPEKLTRREPFGDFYILSKVCRELEQKYNLLIDRGAEKGQEPTRINQRAASMEAHSGQQSFQSYAKEHKAVILQALATAVDWEDLHQAFARHGMGLSLHGNGLAIKDLHSKYATKASALDRTLSLKQLEAKLGPYAPSQEKNLAASKEVSRYEARPLHRAPERGGLSLEYKTRIEERVEKLKTIKEDEDRAIEIIRAKWAQERKQLAEKFLSKTARYKLMKLTRQKEREAVAKIMSEQHVRRGEIKAEQPYSSWTNFLRWKVSQGNEIALAILRSQNEEAMPEVLPDTMKQKRQEIGREFREREQAIRNAKLRGTAKKSLLALMKMKKLVAIEAALLSPGGVPVFAGIKHDIDTKGVIIFTLATGDTIRDTGKQLYFSANNKATQEAALKYAQERWGKQVKMEGNKISKTERQQHLSQGHSR